MYKIHVLRAVIRRVTSQKNDRKGKFKSRNVHIVNPSSAGGDDSYHTKSLSLWIPTQEMRSEGIVVTSSSSVQSSVWFLHPDLELIRLRVRGPLKTSKTNLK